MSARLSRSTTRLLAALGLIASVACVAAAAASPYSHVPKAGDVVKFDGSTAKHVKQHAAWAYPEQNGLENFLRLSVDAALSSAPDNEQAAVAHAKQGALVIDNGTHGLVGNVRSFTYRNHEDTEVQVLVKEGALRNRVFWTTPAELRDPNGHAYLK